MKFLFLTLFFVTSVFAQSDATTDEQIEPKLFGQCYYTFNCIGGSPGSFDDAQCKRMGGHSLEMGGACWQI